MGLLTLLGFGAFVAVSFVAGLRLLLLSRRTREVPEFAFGGALFLGGVGFCLYTLAAVKHALPADLNRAGMIAGVTCLDLGVLLNLLGVWRVFRPGKRWAATIFAASVAALTAHLCAVILTYDPSRGGVPFTFWTFAGIAAAGYLWCASECFRYYGLLRKRVRLGLAEPEMAHRLLLWGCASTAALLQVVINVLNRLVAGQGMDANVLVVQSLVGLVCAVSLWFSFFPPTAYLRLVLGEQATS